LENQTADAVVKHLNILRIARLVEWDVLAFIHRHGTSLASAEKIAALVGCTKVEVGAALESLSANGLLLRSRNSHGVRLYRSDPQQQLAIEELMKIAEDRQGRLLLAKQFHRAARGGDMRERGGLHLA
jgi:DNA-binding MarR family transcriptional regulator